MTARTRIRRIRGRDLAALVAFVPAAALFGCSGDEATGPDFREEIAVFAYLYVGEGATAYVTRVRPVDAYYDPREAAVRDARVIVTRDGAVIGDTLPTQAEGYYVDPDLRVEPGTAYRLRVEIPGEEPITATTETPAAFTVSGGPPAPPSSVSHDGLGQNYPIRVDCLDPRQIFLIDVYCEEDWQDARYINPFGDHDRPDDFQEYGGANNEPRHIQAWFRIEDLVRDGALYRLDFYAAMMVFYGGYDLQVLSIDDNYYNYLYRDDPEENGGIAGGIGVFGSAGRVRYPVEVIE